MGVGGPRAAGALEAREVEEALARAPVAPGQRAARLEGRLRESVDERAAAPFHALVGREPLRWGEAERREAEPGNGRRPERDAYAVHLVLVGVVSRGVEPLQVGAAI